MSEKKLSWFKTNIAKVSTLKKLPFFRQIKKLQIYIKKKIKKVNVIYIFLIIIVVLLFLNLLISEREKYFIRYRLKSWINRVKPKVATEYILVDDICTMEIKNPDWLEINDEILKTCDEKQSAEIKKNYQDLIDGEITRIPFTYNMRKECIDDLWEEQDLDKKNDYMIAKEYKCSKSVEDGGWFWIFGKRMLKISD